MTQPTYTTVEHIKSALPADIRESITVDDRLPLRASRIIDEALLGVIYDVDDATQMPTDPAVVTTLDEATAAQAAWMILTGDEDGTGATPGTPQSATVGRASWSGMTQAQTGARLRSGATLAPEAGRILVVEGLVPTGVRVRG